MNMEELQAEKMVIREVETGISSSAVGGRECSPVSGTENNSRDRLQGVRKCHLNTGHW